MSTSYRIKMRDEQLLMLAKKVFGDSIVVNAWKTIDVHPDWNSCDLNSSIRKLRGMSFDSVSSESAGGMSLEDGVVVEFSSGNQVEFFLSEWGGAKSVDVSKYKDA